eukprot:6780294-Prymnesium_polylepis.1
MQCAKSLANWWLSTARAYGASASSPNAAFGIGRYARGGWQSPTQQPPPCDVDRAACNEKAFCKVQDDTCMLRSLPPDPRPRVDIPSP